MTSNERLAYDSERCSAGFVAGDGLSAVLTTCENAAGSCQPADGRRYRTSRPGGRRRPQIADGVPRAPFESDAADDAAHSFRT